MLEHNIAQYLRFFLLLRWCASSCHLVSFEEISSARYGIEIVLTALGQGLSVWKDWLFWLDLGVLPFIFRLKTNKMINILINI